MSTVMPAPPCEPEKVWELEYPAYVVEHHDEIVADVNYWRARLGLGEPLDALPHDTTGVVGHRRSHDCPLARALGDGYLVARGDIMLGPGNVVGQFSRVTRGAEFAWDLARRRARW